MKWQDYRRSKNVDDRRGDRPTQSSPLGPNSAFSRGGEGPGGIDFSNILIPIIIGSLGRRGRSGQGAYPGGGRRRIGILPILILGLLAYFFFLRPMMQPDVDSYAPKSAPYERAEDLDRGRSRDLPQARGPANQSERWSGRLSSEAELADFSTAVLAMTEDVWSEIFEEAGLVYEKPELVLYSNFTYSGCGSAVSQMGPFYCPNDQKIYLDLSFYRDMQNKLGAAGDSAFAYVIAHEVGHHVQNQLGILAQVHRMEARVSKREANQLSVRTELQADYFAGVFAHHIEKAGILEFGDIEEAMDSAASVGDDRLQKASQGFSVPDSFTHGSSKKRVAWFKRGYESGTIDDGDTFSADISEIY